MNIRSEDNGAFSKTLNTKFSVPNFYFCHQICVFLWVYIIPFLSKTRFDTGIESQICMTSCQNPNRFYSSTLDFH